MKTLAFLLLAATAFASELTTFEKELQRTVRRVSPTIVAMYATDGRGPRGTMSVFSGVVLDAAGTILTGQETLNRKWRREIFAVYPGGSRPVKVRIKHKDAIGFALLEPLERPRPTPRSARAITTDATLPGTPVVLVGAIWGNDGFGDPSASWGTISSIAKDGTMRASTRLNLGTKGAPLFDLKGGLVGIALRERNGETVVLPYERVREKYKSIPNTRARKLGTGVADALTLVVEEAAARARHAVVGVFAKGLPPGSGIVVAPGFVLCSARSLVTPGAARAATPIHVRFGAKPQAEATIVAWDARLRLALLKVDTPKDCKPLSIAPRPNRGQFAIAIGHPQRVTAGIIGRHGALRDLYPAFDAIHTDAHVSVAHAGGALVDTRGRLIGMIMHIDDTEKHSYRTQKHHARYGESTGLGFVIPMSRITPLLPRMKNGIHFTRPYLGVKSRVHSKGLLVEATRGKSPSGNATPAHTAGLNAGDVLVKLAGRKLVTRHDLQIALHEHTVDDAVDLSFLRDGQTITKTVTLCGR